MVLWSPDAEDEIFEFFLLLQMRVEAVFVSQGALVLMYSGSVYPRRHLDLEPFPLSRTSTVVVGFFFSFIVVSSLGMFLPVASSSSSDELVWR